MRKLLIICITTGLFLGCSNLKNAKKQLASGNYDQSINLSLTYLQKNRYGKKSGDYYQVIHESYVKAVNDDKININYLQTDTNPESLEKLYNTYLKLEQRQNKIKPLLPINGHNFVIEDYSFVKLNTRNKLSEYLYSKAKAMYNSNNKDFVKQSHDDFKYIQEINPNYKDVLIMIDQSRTKGMDYVLVSLKNNTDKLIPNRLAADLLNINQYNLNNYWTTHHSVADKNIAYDYKLVLSFDNINISPEKITEVFINQEKEIVDGKTYVLDENGNVKKDANGNDIKVDKKVKITSIVHQFTQNKFCTVTATANILRAQNNEMLQAFPIKSEFVFEHRYASYSGDKRALVQMYLDMILLKQETFPSNEQMILDTGNDIKRQLQNILTNQKFN